MIRAIPVTEIFIRVYGAWVKPLERSEQFVRIFRGAPIIDTRYLTGCGRLFPYLLAPVYCPGPHAGFTSMDTTTAETLIRVLGLEVLPVEGGHFRQTYRAGETVTVAGTGGGTARSKPRATAILYLLSAAPDSFSALHRLPTDEIYHFYLGNPVELLLLRPGGDSEVVTLGHEVLNGQQLQFVVPADAWQGARLAPGGEFALLGTTMAPGFIEEDYVPGDRDSLLGQYPDRAGLIRQLTR